MLKKTSEDGSPIHIGDIVQNIAEHAATRPDQISKQSATLVANQLLASRFTSKNPTGEKPEIGWTRRLPHTIVV